MKKVMVVDDDNNVLRVLLYVLEKSGFSVITAGNGQEGLEMFESHRPAAIITDISMPRLDGEGLCRQIVEKYKNSMPYIFVMTAKTDHSIRDWISKIAKIEFMEKPISPKLLAARLSELL
jgi:two-component system alkaline phosphatase synthesis response regulator PhoP